MCIACENLSKVYDGSQNLMVSRFNNKKTGTPTFILVQDTDDGPQSVTIKVRFCPWCGVKLSND